MASKENINPAIIAGVIEPISQNISAFFRNIKRQKLSQNLSKLA
jgi:hypothetical protein